MYYVLVCLLGAAHQAPERLEPRHGANDGPPYYSDQSGWRERETNNLLASSLPLSLTNEVTNYRKNKASNYSFEDDLAGAASGTRT